MKNVSAHWAPGFLRCSGKLSVAMEFQLRELMPSQSKPKHADPRQCNKQFPALPG